MEASEDKTIPLDKGISKPRFAQIRDHILGEIARGTLKPRQRLPTLRKWAAESGVAYETMSRAIRELVAAGVLDTCPGRGTIVSPSAGRKRRPAGAVGVVTAEPYQKLMTTSRYYGHMMPVAHDELVAHHERVVSERWTPDLRLDDMFDRCRLIDGMLLLGNEAYPVSEIQAIESLGVPVVCLGGKIEDKSVWTVKGDDFGDTRDAVLRLSMMGHERIVAVVPDKDPRFRAYVQGLEDAGLDFEPTYALWGSPEEIADGFVALKPAPSALCIMRHMDKVVDILHGLQEKGVDLAEDVYVCCYDEDLWNTVAPMGIPYARIEQPIREIALTAAKVLLGRIEGTLRGPTHTLLRSRFVEIPGRRNGQ